MFLVCLAQLIIICGFNPWLKRTKPNQFNKIGWKFSLFNCDFIRNLDYFKLTSFRWCICAVGCWPPLGPWRLWSLNLLVVRIRHGNLDVLWISSAVDHCLVGCWIQNIFFWFLEALNNNEDCWKALSQTICYVSRVSPVWRIRISKVVSNFDDSSSIVSSHKIQTWLPVPSLTSSIHVCSWPGRQGGSCPLAGKW